MELKQVQKRQPLKCAIVCGAPINNLQWLKKQLENYNYIIAADSGYDYLLNINVKPDILIGDFDSIREVPNGINIIKYPTKKDDTDFSICLQYCLNSHINSVDVFAAWGGRAGHSIGAVFAMLEYHKLGLNIKIIDVESELFFVSDKHTLPKNNGYVSIFALDGDVEGVTLRGFEYPLSNHTLKCCSPLGVSNSIVNEYGEISIKNGNLLIVIENQ